MTKEISTKYICDSIETFEAHIIALLIILLNAGFFMLDQTLGFDLWDLYDWYSCSLFCGCVVLFVLCIC